MKKTIHTTVFPLLLFALAVSGCRCKDDDKPCTDPSNPDCENYDPCYGKTPANASFHFYADISNDYRQYHYKTDTVERLYAGGYRRIHLKADDPTVDSCWWTVGSDVRTFTEKEFYLDFGGTSSSQEQITVQLVVEKKNIQQCFPNLPARDTFVRHLQFMPAGTKDITGAYFGYLDGNPDDTLTFYIRIENHQIIKPIGRTRIFGKWDWEFLYIVNGWNEFGISSFSPDSHLPYFVGHGSLERNELNINFRSKFEEDDFKTKERTFKGIRK